MRKRRWPLVLIVGTVLLIVGSVALATSQGFRYATLMIADALVYGVTTTADEQQSQPITDAIVTAHHFQHNSPSAPGRPPVFVHPGSRFVLTKPIKAVVYDIDDQAEQDRVIAAVQVAVAEHKSPPVDLHFLAHENWTMSDRYGERGPETQLRRVRITASSARNREGEKLISYQTP